MITEMKPDLDKSLEQLENEIWKEPSYDSHLVKTIYALRKKPLGLFTPEDLRIVIGQNFSLEYLIPIAIEKLQENILSEGNLYPGDLLNNVLNADVSFWRKNKKEWEITRSLVENNKYLLMPESEYRAIIKSFEKFEQINK